MSDVKEFHRKRIMFAYINNQFVEFINDDRDHLTALKEDYHISNDEFKHIIRGYYLNNGVFIYKDFDFEPVPIYEYPVGMMDDLIGIVNEYATEKHISVKIFNGLKIGRIGEPWKPVQLIGIYENSEIHYRKSANSTCQDLK